MIYIYIYICMHVSRNEDRETTPNQKQIHHTETYESKQFALFTRSPRQHPKRLQLLQGRWNLSLPWWLL